MPRLSANRADLFHQFAVHIAFFKAANELMETAPTARLTRREPHQAASQVTPVSRRGLAWLLQPVSCEEFFHSYWERRSLAIKRTDAGYYRHLPGLEEVDGLITSTTFGSGARKQEGRLVRTGRDGRLFERPLVLNDDGQPDIHDVYRAYDEGYTVVLNGMHGRSSVVGALCRELETDFHFSVGANLYLTPRGAQGFRAHVDTHDVFIVQVHGTKEWRVGVAPARLFPTCTLPSEPVDSIQDPRDYRLTPGDALYIPRGYAHEAVTQASSSLHLTFGIHAVTWADLLTEAVRLLAAEKHQLRRALPVGHLDSAIDEAHLEELGRHALGLTSGSVLEAARVSLGSKLLRRQAATAGHFRSLDGVADLTVDSVVVRGFEGPCRVRAVGERVVADYPGNFLSVPSFLAPALEYAATTRAFPVGSIPGDLGDSARIEFAARLVSEGFLSVVSDAGEVRS